MIQYSISLYGQVAALIGQVLEAGSCYGSIFSHGKRVAQLEVVMDDLVDVTLFPAVQVAGVVHQLDCMGFGGCWASVQVEDVQGCMITTISQSYFFQIY